jgi:hypothetical protein
MINPRNKSQLFLLLFFSTAVFGLMSCKDYNEKKSTVTEQTGNVKDSVHLDYSPHIRFDNIEQIYRDTSSTKWTDKGSFDWLYFEPGKIFFDFNPSCGYWFPTILKENKIIFYWARNMNCNFRRGLDTSFKGVKSPKIGDMFGEALLVNDTTIQINYYHKEWVRRINEAEYATIDTLFPSVFRIIHL